MQKLRKLVPAYFLGLIFLSASWALFTPHFFRVHDFTHAGRIAEMARALGDGHFPVRWTQNFGYGYGMPLFEFYGPLPFYVGGVLYWLGVNVITSIKALYLIANAVTLLGSYRLGKKFFGPAGGLITAAALTLAPYRALNLYVRGAVNEAWAIAFLPWILLGVIQIFQRQRRGWLTLTVSLTGLLLSHNITTLLFLPVLGLFVALYFGGMIWRRVPELFRQQEFRWRNFFRLTGQLLGSALLAFGLSAFYVVPAFAEKSLTQLEKTIFTPYFDYHLHFLYIRQFFNPSWGYGGSGWSVTDDISFFLGWGQWLAVGILVALILRKSWSWLRYRTPIFSSKRMLAIMCISGALLVGALYMSILKSQWLWDSLPLLKFAQFPWRWLGVAIVFLSLLLGSIGSFIVKKPARIAVTLLLVIAMIISSIVYFRPEKYLDRTESFYYTDPQLIRRELSGILPDYIPASMTMPPSVIPEGLIVNLADVPATEYEILTDRTHEKLISTVFKTETRLSLAVADYPGWSVEIDNQRWNRQLGIDGNIELLVPPGSHLVAVRFLATAIRQYSDWASLFAWILLIGLLLPSKMTAEPGHKGRTS